MYKQVVNDFEDYAKELRSLEKMEVFEYGKQ